MRERCSGLDALAGSGVGLEELSTARAADLTLVCSNGMRIAIEVTATGGENIQAKFDHWFATLDDPARSFAATGLVVIFLLAPKPGEQHKKASDALRRQVHAAVLDAARRHDLSGRVPARLRIGVADWREWFPGPQLASDAFLRLRANRPAKLWSDNPEALGFRKPSDYSEAWEPADFLDGATRPIAGVDTAMLLWVVEYSRLLGQSVHWHRDLIDVDALERHQLWSSGISCGGDPRLAEGVGAARDTRLPKRMLGLAGFAPRAIPDPPLRTRNAGDPDSRLRIDATALEDSSAIALSRVSAAHALLEVTFGRLTRWQLVEAATMDSDSPIRAITLMQLLMAVREATPETAAATLRCLAVALDEDVDHVSSQYIGWLVNANSGGRRMAAARTVGMHDGGPMTY